MTSGQNDGKQSHVKTPKSIEKAFLPVIILVIAAVVLGAGVGIWKLKAAASVSSGSGKSAKFPSFVYDHSAPKDTPKAYQAAVDYGDDFSQVPCYCGCGTMAAGHESLRDCFIASGSGDNASYDNHGAGCTICVVEALDVLQGKNDGKTIKEIRSFIDNKYGGDKFADPTPTPAV